MAPAAHGRLQAQSSIANLQVSLPAIVIGGGLTAIDTATELLAYYLCRSRRSSSATSSLARSGDAEATCASVRRRGVGDARASTSRTRRAAPRREEARARAEGREPRRPDAARRVGRRHARLPQGPRRLARVPPEPRRGRQEPRRGRALRREPVADRGGARRARPREGDAASQRDGRRATVELPARTVCVAAGTSPNVTYEKEYPGTFELDERRAVLPAARRARSTPTGKRHARAAAEARDDGLLHELRKDGRTVSFYGDNHPHYAGSVVKAMASAKDGYPHVVALFPEVAGARRRGAAGARRASCARSSRSSTTSSSRAVHEVNRLTPTIVEVVVRAPMAARKFQPGQFYRLQNFEIARAGRAIDGHAALADGGASRSPARGSTRRRACSGRSCSRWAAARASARRSSRASRSCSWARPGTPTEIASEETVLLAAAASATRCSSRSRALQGARRRGALLRGLQARRGPLQARRHRALHRPGHLVHRQRAPRSRRAARRTRTSAATSSRRWSRTGRASSASRRRSRSATSTRIIAIGSDRMMNAVREARHGVLAPLLDPSHLAIGSINSPMQCMMKEVCAQCLQKHATR